MSLPTTPKILATVRSTKNNIIKVVHLDIKSQAELFSPVVEDDQDISSVRHMSQQRRLILSPEMILKYITTLPAALCLP